MIRSCFAYLFALSLLGCTSAPPPAPDPTSTPTAAPSLPKKPKSDLLTQAKNSMIFSKKGRPWMMNFAQGSYRNGLQQGKLQHVDWTLTDKQGKKLIRIEAPEAKFREEEQVLEFAGGVKARRYDTRDLVKANKMTWSSKTGVFRGSQGVSWDRGKTHVEGDTATTTDKLERIQVDGHVKITTVIEGDPFDTGG